MISISPTIRISMGLILTVICIIILSDMIGFLPDRTAAVIDGRKSMAESLAVQYSLAATKNDFDSIKSSMRILVEKDDEVLSASLRRADGRLIAIAGDHLDQWKDIEDGKSTPTHIQVPIFKNTLKHKKWGTVELCFSPVNKINFLGYSITPLFLMLSFVGITGFIVFLFIIRVILRKIDPASVIPARVKNALDNFTEGVLITDEKNRIILANKAFAEYVNLTIRKLVGKNAARFEWKTSSDSGELPWETATRTGQSLLNKQLHLTQETGEENTYIVNSTVIKDDNEVIRGIMSTFDDISLLEAKNTELESTLHELNLSREKVVSKNKELEILATRDPLTGCLNRRTLFDTFESNVTDAHENNSNLCCIMADIDHFKSINDEYGHSKGDEVIKLVTDTIRSCIRRDDEIFRYGGEEFCLILPGASIEVAQTTADRARAAMAEKNINGTVPGASFKVTSSFGVSTINDGAIDLQHLIDQADKALYASKNTGRNKVTCWSESIETEGKVENAEFIPGVSTRLPKDPEPVNAETCSTEGSIVTPVTSDTCTVHMNSCNSMNDTPTGLPNRTLFRTRLAEVISQSRENNQITAVMLLDIDMFKRINNALGYSAGDNLLKEVASRLGKSLRETDEVGRLDGNSNNTLYGLGGDEFGILISGMESEDHIGNIVERIINSISSPIIIDNHEIHLTCSSGICLFPTDGNDVDTLLTNASLSLQQAQFSGHNSYQFYNKNYSENIQKNFELESELRQALENDQLELYFQPKVDLATMRITSMESLIRWNHPEKGMIPPNDFIPVAENSGLISSIGQWVLHAACAQAREWNEAGFNLTVAVNLSAMQFRQPDLLDKILYATQAEGALPQYIELEITESTIMENFNVTSRIMDELHNAGYMFSIDDFGTGYSSLEHLKRFPINTIKIDRSFINDVSNSQDDAAIVRAIVAMAHSMGLKVVAEGVETDDQLAFLMYLKCDEIQGYLFSRPLPAAEATKLLGNAPNANSDTKKIARAG